MAETTVPANGKGDKLRQRIKLMSLEILFLRENVRFLELLAAERNLKAKRLGLRASFLEGLYKQEMHRQEQIRQAQAVRESTA